MSRLVTSGFELGSVSTAEASTAPDGQRTNDGTGSASYLIQSGSARTGGFGLGINSGVASIANSSHQLWLYTAPALAKDAFLRTYIRVIALPTSASTVHPFMSVDNATNWFYIGVTDDGRFTCRLTPGTTVGSTAANYIVLGAWYRMELRVRIGTGAADEVEMRINGDQIAISTGLNTTDTIPTQARVGIRCGSGVGSGSGTNLDLDDVALNVDDGLSQSTWPGDGNVVLLVPTADSAVGTGWTLGTGTAIASNSGSTAVKNKPPLGVADLAVGSDPKQIRNATANANSNYDATMTTYSAAGITSSTDTINVITPIVATAAPVTTSSKQGTVGVVSNPTIANIALGTIGTSGAFWQGNTAGTYPAGWKWSKGTVTYAPSVTVTTAPVMRITQVTSSTRIAMVCFMGIYVDYTSNRADVLEPSLSRRSTSRRGNRTVKV